MNSSYKYLSSFTEKNVDWLTTKTNRSKAQTLFLAELVDFNWKKLKELEIQLYNCNVFCCPADKNSVDEVMKMVPINKVFVL